MARPARLIPLLASLGVFALGCKPPPIPPATTKPATAPATQPSPPTAAPTAAAPMPAPPADELAVLRLDDPAYPTTAPLDPPADLPDAAKIVLPRQRPAYVDPMGNLWLTHPKGRPIQELLAGPVADRTAVVREPVRYVYWPPDGGPAAAIVGERPAGLRPATGPDAGRLLAVTPTATTPIDELPDADFGRAVAIAGGVVVPTRRGAAVFSPGLNRFRLIAPPSDGSGELTPPVLAATGDGVWLWSPWENGRPGGNGVVYIDAAGPHPHDARDGWPDHVIEIVPLADGSVLVVYAAATGPALKLIPAPDKPPTLELVRTIEPLARQLADRDPTVREAAQRSLEAQGPAALPVLESLRERLPPEAQVRIETMLGQRFAPTLGGLRPMEGRCRTIARFPGGGCALRLEGGGTIDGDDDTPARTVVPATVLIRPGRFVQSIDPEAACDFVPGRQTIQSVGGELMIADPAEGARRWVGLTLLPIAGKAFADFDTVAAIDARRRWLLTSARRPGETLLIDPSLPDTTPKLPVWTVAGEAVGRTEAGWPAVKRGDRLFVLDADGWKTAPPDQLRSDTGAAGPSTAPAAVDGGPRASVVGRVIEAIDARGRTSVTLPETAGDATAVVAGGRLLVYTADGKVRRYAIGDGPTLTPEATFTQGVPPRADRVWLDPAGRLVMTSGPSLAIGFLAGRIPGNLSELILHVDR